MSCGHMSMPTCFRCYAQLKHAHEALTIWRAGAEAMLQQDQKRIATLERWLLDIAHRGHAGEQASCLAADCVDARRVVKAGA